MGDLRGELERPEEPFLNLQLMADSARAGLDHWNLQGRTMEHSMILSGVPQLDHSALDWTAPHLLGSKGGAGVTPVAGEAICLRAVFDETKGALQFDCGDA